MKKEQEASTTPCVTELVNEFEGKTVLSCEGFLFMQQKSMFNLPFYGCKRRYFKLHHDCLYILKENIDVSSDGYANKINIESDTGIFPEENTRIKKKYSIRITQGIRSYILHAFEESDRNTWLSILLTIVTKKVVSTFENNAGRLKNVASIGRRRSFLAMLPYLGKARKSIQDSIKELDITQLDKPKNKKMACNHNLMSTMNYEVLFG